MVIELAVVDGGLADRNCVCQPEWSTRSFPLLFRRSNIAALGFTDGFFDCRYLGGGVVLLAKDLKTENTVT